MKVRSGIISILSTLALLWGWPGGSNRSLVANQTQTQSAIQATKGEGPEGQPAAKEEGPEGLPRSRTQR